MQIPYLIVGCGGRGTIAVGQATGARDGDHSFDSSLVGFGYLTVTANAQNLTLFLTEVDATGAKKPFDKRIVVDLITNQII